MERIKNIIFDFDGTLADTSHLVVATMQKSIKELGLPFRNDAQIKSTIGIRLEEIPTILWPSKKDISESFAKIYRKNFEELKDIIPITLFPGVKETLLKLKTREYQMAIATSRSHQSVDELTGQFGIKDCFVVVVGGNDVTDGKPNPESINKILAEETWKPNETIMVGDMTVDIIMGKNAGVKTCGVTYGNGKTLDLEKAGADLLISDFSIIPDILEC